MMWTPAVERVTTAGVERRCNRCGGWWLREQMRKAKGCRFGYANECRGCANGRKSRLASDPVARTR